MVEMKKPALLSIIIPVYNEEKTVATLLRKVVAARLDPQKARKEIVVVDDGSKDHSADEISKFMAANKTATIKLVRQPANGGKGSAIREGIKHATGDMIIVQDADLEYDPEDYASLIEPIIRGNAVVVYGSRYLTSHQRKRAWSAEHTGKGGSYLSFVIGGRLATYATNLICFTRLTDEPTCYKTFRADVLKSIPLKCTGFEFCPEVTAKVLRRGYRIIEIPIAFYPRTVAEGKKIKWSDGFKAVWTLLRYRFFD